MKQLIINRLKRVALAVFLITGVAGIVVAAETTPPIPENGKQKIISIADPFSGVSKPTTEDEFFRNVKFVLDQGLLLREDFYTKENLAHFFGTERFVTGVEHEDNDSTRFWAMASDLDGIFSPRMRDAASLAVSGTQISTGITIDVSGNKVGRFHFVSRGNGPTFEYVKALFGGVLTPDRSIPNQPPSPATGPHGNEWWRYTFDTDAGEVHGSFGFDSAGFLNDFSFEEEKIK